MQKNLLLIILLFVAIATKAQPVVLGGMTSAGGSNGLGTVFQIKGDGTGFQSMLSFGSSTGTNPVGDLTLVSNSIIYGMTKNGGAYNSGAIFILDATINDTYLDIFDFNDTLGANPYGSLIQASNGLLYGMTDSGGLYNRGVIFSVDPLMVNYSVIYNLNDSTGKYPKGSLFQASNGQLYGMTSYGGKFNYGTIFKFDPILDTVTVLYNFTFTSGIDPQGNLMQAANGKLYGMTQFGGLNNSGTIFSIDTSGNNFTKLHDFVASTSSGNTTGALPTGTLLQDSATQKLYGMASFGGSTSQNGVIFTLDTANHYVDILNFSNTNGQFPQGSFIKASDGKFYGTTFAGGTLGEGVIFKIDPSSNNAYTKLHDFVLTDGANPYGNLIELPQGTGMQNIQSSDEMSIYPNPAPGKFNFKANFSSSKTLEIIVSDNIGETIYKSPIISPLNEVFTIDLSTKAKGIYFVMFKTDNHVEIKKLILN